jgi:hypothetical protein
MRREATGESDGCGQRPDARRGRDVVLPSCQLSMYTTITITIPQVKVVHMTMCRLMRKILGSRVDTATGDSSIRDRYASDVPDGAPQLAVPAPCAPRLRTGPRKGPPSIHKSHGSRSMRWSIVLARTRVQTVDVRSGSVGTDAAFARFARTRERLGLRASRYTLTAFVYSQRRGRDAPRSAAANKRNRFVDRVS